MLLRKGSMIILVVLLGLVVTKGPIAAEEIKTSNQAEFQIRVQIAGQSIEVIPEDINFDVITDLSTSHTAEPATFKVKGSDISYQIKMANQVELTNDNGDKLTVVLDTPDSGKIEGGEDSFQVEATLQSRDEKIEKLEGNYQGTATVTVQYAN